MIGGHSGQAAGIRFGGRRAGIHFGSHSGLEGIYIMVTLCVPPPGRQLLITSGRSYRKEEIGRKFVPLSLF
jgi:hypothetical protein